MSRQSFPYLHYLYSQFKPRRPQLFSSSSSIASSSVSGSSIQAPIAGNFYFDIEEYDSDVMDQQDFCMIDTFETMSTKQILNLINKQPLDFLDSYHTDLIDEFTALLNETKSVCHRLDKCRKTVQFAHTKETISMDLMHIINFVYERYYLHSAHSNSFITLMGLLMIIVQVLNTEDEVQRQLLDESHIGRMAVLFMSRALSNTKIVSHHDLPTCIQNQLFQIVLDYQFHQEDMNTIWFSALKSVCLQLARRDPTWEQKEEYTKVYSEATCLLTE